MTGEPHVCSCRSPDKLEEGGSATLAQSPVFISHPPPRPIYVPLEVALGLLSPLKCLLCGLVLVSSSCSSSILLLSP